MRELITNACIISCIMSLEKISPYLKFYKTLFSACYASKQTLIADIEQVLCSLVVYTYVDGDGTISMGSTMADGLETEISNVQETYVFSHKC